MKAFAIPSVLAFLSLPVTQAVAACVASPPPASWSSEHGPSPTASEPVNAENPLTLVITRHAEKPLGEDGLMKETGNLGEQAAHRLSRLPDTLLKQFGCPDLLVTAKPTDKMINKRTGQYFYYVRPLATMEPLSQKINFPIWMPYGYLENESLARDLLNDPAFRPRDGEKAKKIFIVWERNSITKLFDQLKAVGNLRSLAGSSLTVDGVQYRCEEPPKWEQCDFDSIWLVQVKDKAICLSHRNENLNSKGFQKSCKGAESTTDQPAPH
jgi:hypothetical protein